MCFILIWVSYHYSPVYLKEKRKETRLKNNVSKLLTGIIDHTKRHPSLGSIRVGRAQKGGSSLKCNPLNYFKHFLKSCYSRGANLGSLKSRVFATWSFLCFAPASMASDLPLAGESSHRLNIPIFFLFVATNPYPFHLQITCAKSQVPAAAQRMPHSASRKHQPINPNIYWQSPKSHFYFLSFLFIFKWGLHVMCWKWMSLSDRIKKALTLLI